MGVADTLVVVAIVLVVVGMVVAVKAALADLKG